ncbi:WSC domain-containing protein [Colletotrichum tofieldiae]|nr:WSC domain-containing protein [Colletotrichum tofieldiae]
MSPLNSRMPAVVSGQWQYAGCFKDLVNNTRLLGEAFLATDDMTLDKCAAFCSKGAYNDGAFNYFGVEYSRECFCGWDVKAAQTSTSESDCSSSCAGSPIGLCGAGNRLSVYNNTIPNQTPTDPQHVPRANDYKFLGCQTEGANGRALTGKFTAADTLTVEDCASFCSVDGWQFMGVEYGRECFCGNSTNAGSVPAPLGDCNMVCKGNKRIFKHRTLYKLDNFEFLLHCQLIKPGVGSRCLVRHIIDRRSFSAHFIQLVGQQLDFVHTTVNIIVVYHSCTYRAGIDNSKQLGRHSTKHNDWAHSYSHQRLLLHRLLPGRQLGSRAAWPVRQQQRHPELCIDYANSKFSNSPTSTTKMPYVFLEYHHECYGGATFDFKGAAVTSLVGKQACKDYCYGSVSTFTTNGKATTTTGTANYCGGRGCSTCTRCQHRSLSQQRVVLWPLGQ